MPYDPTDHDLKLHMKDEEEAAIREHLLEPYQIEIDALNDENESLAKENARVYSNGWTFGFVFGIILGATFTFLFCYIFLIPHA